MFKYLTISTLTLFVSSLYGQGDLDTTVNSEREVNDQIVLLLKNISLEDAIKVTLENQRAIQISQMQVAEQRGIVQRNAGPFDPLLDLGVDYLTKQDRQYFPSGLRTDYGGHQSISFGELKKLTRIGTIFSLTANVNQTYDLLDFIVGLTPDVKTNQGTISFLIDQPLLNGFMWGADVTNERASKKDLAALIYENLFEVSNRINDTVNSYWEVIGAREFLKIREQNLENFRELEKKTKILIDNHQLPKAEILQPQAQVAQGEVEVILAKQELFSAIQQFLFNLGIAEDGIKIPFEELIDVNFPPVPEDFPILLEQVNDFLKYAPMARPDILALYMRQDSAAILVKGGYNSVLPNLNVVGGVTKQDFYVRDKAKSFYRPLDMKKPETDFRIGLRFSYPLCNNSARGVLYERKAFLNRIVLSTQQLIQDTYRDIMDQWSDIIASSHALKKNAQVIKKNKNLVEYETIKLKAGYSTLFVLIDFQNRLANAMSERVILKKRFMQGISNIRFLTGTLITPTRFLECYRVEDVTKLPKLDDSTLEEYQSCIRD